MSEGEVLIRCDQVSKKFCKNLKRSLFYALQDFSSDLFLPGRVRDLATVSLRSAEFWAIRDVSFEVRRGEAMALMGVNGAGKTTLLKVLNGIIKPDAGRVEIRGVVGALIALGAGFNPILTGRENIYANGAVLGFSKADIKARLEEIVDFAGLADFIDSPVRNYSSGMQVRLGFSIATCMDPDVLLIDEVLAVGDFGFRARCYGRLAKLMEGTAIIFVSHSAQQMTRICGRGLLLDRGEVVKNDDLARVLLEYNKRSAPATKIRTTYDGELELIEAKATECEIQFGGDLTLEIAIESQQVYRNCFIRILVRKTDEEVVGEWNSELHDHHFDLPVGRSEHAFTVKGLRLHDGVYRLSFFLMAEDRVTHLINAANVDTVESFGLCYGGVPVQF